MTRDSPLIPTFSHRPNTVRPVSSDETNQTHPDDGTRNARHPVDGLVSRHSSKRFTQLQMTHRLSQSTGIQMEQALLSIRTILR